MKNYFKPKDFEHLEMSDYYPIEIAAELANKKLNDLIESWPVVYSECLIPGWTPHAKDKNKTHKARLAFVEPIVKEPCKHEPTEYDVHWKNIICKHCGIELTATWKEKV